jgi:plastocyanin
MRSVAVATVICLAAVGCAKDKTESPSSGGKAPVALSGTVNDKGTKDVSGKDEFELEQDDFYFSPTFVKAKPGATIKVEVSNEGDAQHTFTIDALHIDVMLAKGESKDVSVTLPSSGAVAFYCRFHRSSGMQGAFYFNEGDTVGSGGTAPSGAASSSGSDDGGAYGK